MQAAHSDSLPESIGRKEEEKGKFTMEKSDASSFIQVFKVNVNSDVRLIVWSLIYDKNGA